MSDGSPALWRSLLVLVAALAIGLAVSPLAAAAGTAVGPSVGRAFGAVFQWRADLLRAIGVGFVIGVIAFGVSFVMGLVLKAGRYVAGWLFGFGITESLWRPAIANLIEGGHARALDHVFLTLVQALAVSLIATLALDAGRRTRLRK